MNTSNLSIQSKVEELNLTFVKKMPLEGVTLDNVYSLPADFDHLEFAKSVHCAGITADKRDVKFVNFLGFGYISYTNNKDFPNNKSFSVMFYNDLPIALEFKES